MYVMYAARSYPHAPVVTAPLQLSQGLPQRISAVESALAESLVRMALLRNISQAPASRTKTRRGTPLARAPPAAFFLVERPGPVHLALLLGRPTTGDGGKSRVGGT